MNLKDAWEGRQRGELSIDYGDITYYIIYQQALAFPRISNLTLFIVLTYFGLPNIGYSGKLIQQSYIIDRRLIPVVTGGKLFPD